MKKKILVVDDDTTTLEAIQIALEMEGYIVEMCTNGGCLQYLTLNEPLPDLILLDILLSGEDGRVICMSLKQRQDTRNIPIILYSAHVSGDIITYLSGASTFLAKPFDLDELIAIAARYTTAPQIPTPSMTSERVFSETVREE